MIELIKNMFVAHPFWFLVLTVAVLNGVQGLVRAILRVPGSPIITVNKE